MKLERRINKEEKLRREKIKEKKKDAKRRMKRLVVMRNQFNSHPFYSSAEWMKLRYSILVKRGKRCEACGFEGLNVRFHIDHIKPRSKFPELELQESNLQVLCEPCNLGKGAWDETDWRNLAGSMDTGSVRD